MNYNKHFEIFPFVLKNYHLFDRVVVNTVLEKRGFSYYIVFECDILPKYVNWYVYKSEQEDNFINLLIDEFYKFTFKVPSDYQWYVPIVYKSGVKAIHPNHILKFFVYDNTLGGKNAAQGICLIIQFHYLIFYVFTFTFRIFILFVHIAPRKQFCKYFKCV